MKEINLDNVTHTRSGREVLSIHKAPTIVETNFPIIAWIEGYSSPIKYYKNGRTNKAIESNDDLVENTPELYVVIHTQSSRIIYNEDPLTSFQDAVTFRDKVVECCPESHEHDFEIRELVSII